MCRGNTNLKLHETPTKGVWVEGLTECYVSSADEALNIIEVGDKCRSVAHTQVRFDTPKCFFGASNRLPFFFMAKELGSLRTRVLWFFVAKEVGVLRKFGGSF